MGCLAGAGAGGGCCLVLDPGTGADFLGTGVSLARGRVGCLSTVLFEHSIRGDLLTADAGLLGCPGLEGRHLMGVMGVDMKGDEGRGRAMVCRISLGIGIAFKSLPSLSPFIPIGACMRSHC
jgi:hypothetical protein